MMTGNSLQVATAAIVGFALAEDKSLATLPLAMQFFATMIFTMPAARIMKSCSRRFGFHIGISSGVSGAVLAGTSILLGNFVLFCVATFLIGVFNAFGTYYRFAAAELVSESYRAKAISYVMLAGVVAAIIGPNLSRLGKSWFANAPFAGSYLALAGVYFLSFLLIAKIHFNELDEQQQHRQGRSLWELLRQTRLKVAIIIAMLGYAVMSLTMTATPLAMKHNHHDFSHTALVIQWHVVAMFAPSFFTGKLISRFGLKKVLLTGVLLELLCIVINLNGTTLIHFWFALFLLGVGWNFLFVGASTLLTETYRPEERSRVQGFNDFIVFAVVTLSSLSAGALQHYYGWQKVNLLAIPMILVILTSIIRLFLYDQKTSGK